MSDEQTKTVQPKKDGATLRYLYNKLKKLTKDYNKTPGVECTATFAITDSLEIIAHYEAIAKKDIPAVLRLLADKIEEGFVVEEH